MPQHGLARHREFTLVSQEKNELWFSLTEGEETLRNYPFRFELLIGYVLQDRAVKVIWQVINRDEKTMYYSIGGHPAFNCPLNKSEKKTDYSIWFHGVDKICSRGIDMSNGLATEQITEYKLEQEKLPITETLFDRDALVIENQVHSVSLVKPDGTPYLTVDFEAPLFGVWAPVGGKSPFVCIEPWYGRCDSQHYAGDLAGREYGHTILPGDQDEFSYWIRIEDEM
ncbi:MAG: aldose 1-epimerase family protein [Lachnospiraceae bacterium]|nr:aldose 1-epimerase family protein [Lachnospiraceae bacterium]